MKKIIQYRFGYSSVGFVAFDYRLAVKRITDAAKANGDLNAKLSMGKRGEL